MKKEVNLLEGNILKKLFILSAPLMATSFVQMAYNLTDLIWVGKVGTEAVAATGTAGFFMWIAMSLVLIPRIGISVLTSQYYGEGNHKKVRDVIKNGFLLTLIIVVLYFTIIQLFARQFIGFYKLDQAVNEMAIQYLRYIALGFFMTFFNPVFSSTYNSMGDSFTPFSINVVGLIVNIILDPLLIFGFGPIKAMGVKGAAIATVTAQLIVFILFVIDNIKRKGMIYRSRQEGSLDREIFTQVFKIGLPTGMQSAMHASITMVLSRFMSKYGAKPIAVYSVGSMIESLTWMTTEGFAVGITAFVGQNFGARKIDRLKEVIRKSMTSVALIGLMSSFILIGFRNNLFYIFLPKDPEAIKMGSYYLLILGMSQFFMAIEIGAAGIFNGLSNTKTPAMISMGLNIMRIPFALIFMTWFEFYGVWMAMSFTSILKGIIMAILLRRENKSIDMDMN